MTLYVAHHSFSGPFSSTALVENRAGLYALVQPEGSGWRVLDVGQGADLQITLEKVLRQRDDEPAVQLAVRYTPGMQHDGRVRLVEAIRAGLAS
jgi:hypothetical protein